MPGPATTASPALTVPVYRVGRMPATGVLAKDNDDELVRQLWDELVRDGITIAIIETPSTLHFIARTEAEACPYDPVRSTGLT